MKSKQGHRQDLTTFINSRNIIYMAHKKGSGSTKNGRDSKSKR